MHFGHCQWIQPERVTKQNFQINEGLCTYQSLSQLVLCYWINCSGWKFSDSSKFQQRLVIENHQIDIQMILWPARGAGGSCYVFCPSLRQRWSTLLVLLFFHVNLLCMYKRFEIINHLHSHGWHNLLSWSPQHNWAQIYVQPLTFTRLTNQI